MGRTGQKDDAFLCEHPNNTESKQCNAASLGKGARVLNALRALNEKDYVGHANEHA